MTKSWMVCSIVLVASTAFAKAGGAWDEKAAGELKTIVQNGYDGFSKGDTRPILDNVADDVWGGSWDLGPGMQPITDRSKADLAKSLDTMMGMMKQMGGSVSWKTTRLDCRASGGLGVFQIEGDQTMTMPKMPPMTVSMRATEVFQKEAAKWKWVHHHTSVAKTPPFPPHMAAFSGKSQGFIDAGDPSMPGVQMIPIWMNPANMYGVAIMKATQTVVQPRHIHPFPFTFAVLQGSIVTSDASGKDVEYGPGSIVYRAPNEPHKTTIKAGAVVMGVMAGPQMTVPVGANGQPEHAQK